MNSNLGNTLRKIRKSKGISITAIADEYLSKSQISRFERGESEISCIRLINLLNKLNISLEEFINLYQIDNNETKNFWSLLKLIRKEYSLQRTTVLEALLSKKSQYSLNNLDAIMIKSIISTINTSFLPTDEEMQQLTDYLFKIEKWGSYEIILLGNCSRTIKYSALFLLTKEMLGNYIHSPINTNNINLVTQLAINCLIASIDFGMYADSIYLISEINRLLQNEFNYYEKTIFLYAKGYFEFKNKLEQEGEHKMLQALKIMEILNEIDVLKQYSEHYQSNCSLKN
ncbi:helix-turn-helix domain-containing protein [Streptococcus suis]|uniref:Helix-turn-helix domain-containing protein n=1 Tax=Streptococcus suis TaxID=1307 RepID=A0A9X4MJQ4_STRSU|nr:helix-turn-helix domain-containing protein [Streptococcus suis]